MAVRGYDSPDSTQSGADHALGAAPPASAGPGATAVWLRRVLDRQLELFVTLDALCREQSVMVARQDTDSLLTVLAQRQEVLERIVGLSDRVDPLKERWAEVSAALPEAERAGLRERFEAIDRAVSDISQRDDADRAALERERTAISDELSEMGRTRGAMSAYSATSQAGTPSATPSPRYQDRTG